MHFKVLSEQDAANLSNKLKDGDWMVLYYADWCGHCKTMKPEWQKVVNKFSGNQSVNVAEVESTLIDKLSHRPQVQGFPTIKMYQSGNEVAQFEDERVADKMEKFALSNSSKRSMSHQMHRKVTRPHHVTRSYHRKPTHHTKRRVSHSKKSTNKPSTMRSVFSKLIKSFGRIGNEAEKDEKLLKRAKPLLT